MIFIIIHSTLFPTAIIHAHCNIPWAILLDPTAACNLKCIGCWSAEYNKGNSLSYETIDMIITEGKDLGIHMYERVHAYRKEKPIFLMDFWNDGEYVNGCIAGGRRRALCFHSLCQR